MPQSPRTGETAGPRRRSAVADFVADPRHGPLPLLLLVLTVSTGVVDAVSILSLGRVFVANMTGNVVFIGFALAGAPGFSLQASVIALFAFLLGAGAGGMAVARFGARRGVLLRNVVAAELALLLVALVVAVVASTPFDAGARDVIAALAALALGMQNAAVRRLAVPDLTTTVLTMTLTGIAADLRTGKLSTAVRRVSAVVAMLVGALIGAVLVLHVDAAAALAVACVLVGAVAVGAAFVARSDDDWQAG